MKLRMQVGLGPGQIVLDGDPAPPPPKGGGAPNFWPIFVAKRLDGSRCHLVRRYATAQAALCYMETQLPLPKWAQPQFSAMSVVTKRSPISATAEHYFVVMFMAALWNRAGHYIFAL